MGPYQLEIMKTLLDHGADVSAVSDFGQTPLLIASAAPQAFPVIELLLKSKADPNTADKQGIIPIQVTMFLSYLFY